MGASPGAPDGDALGRDMVTGFLAQLAGARVERYPSLGLGTDVRLEGKGAEGSAVVCQDVTVCLVAFPLESRPQHRHRAITRAHRCAGASSDRWCPNKPIEHMYCLHRIETVITVI